MSIEHTLPKDDLARGIDLIITAGDELSNMQLKAPPDGGAASVHHQEKIAKAKEALIGKPVSTVVIGYEVVEEAFDLEKMEPEGDNALRLKELQAEILRVLEKQMEGKHDMFLEIMGNLKARIEPKQKPRSLFRRRLERNTSVSTLRAFGLVTPEEERDLAAIVEIKKRFFEATKGLIKTPGDLEHPPPELVEKVRQAAGKRAEA
jgi:hypothetical protein